jgi:hypothetical protein
MRNPLTRSNGTESDSRARTAATPTDLPQERVGPAADVRARQREEFGGFSFGSVFFGWLVAIGLATLLIGGLAVAGDATGIFDFGGTDVSDNADTVGVGGGIVLLAVLLVSHYAGGYVAGRLARFDGARQGIGVWILGTLVTGGLAVAAAIADDDTVTGAGAITVAAIVLGTLLAAIAGGKVGERFHRRVDRVAFDTPLDR